jgi:hypothetical protein
MPSCNNKLCEPAAGENCVTCPADCGCPAGQTCINGTCCQPQCAGKQCGGDGCGGSCGTCQAGFVCQGGACLPTGQPCGQVTSYGCCSGETLQWCNNGVLASLNCAQNPKCGWDPFAGYYDCATAGGQDPSGAHPKACPGPCVPACVGFECGDDGCGGICGECADGETCENGVCVGACVPQCAGKECGNDGCGGSCGLCDPGCSCVNGKCQGCECIPDCAGKECGDDACGGSCGECPPGWSCQFWKCVPCLPDCAGKECGDNGCGGSCGICPDGCPCENGQCVGCTCWPNCAGKQCGFDGCGGSCGECDAGYVCNPQWQCVEQTCLPSCVGKECGDDACGGSCGVCLNYCPTPEHPDVPYPDSSLCMIDHHCVQACCPQCGGKECGDDGCGGVCGVCQGANEVCLAFKCICQPDCDGKECGPDGCGGSCGTCDGKEECVNGGCRGGGVDAGGEVETSGDAVAADAEEIPVDVGTEIQLKGPGSGGCDTGRQSAGALPAALLLVLLLTALPLVLRRTR